MKTIKISSLPRNIPQISTISVAARVVGPVMPMDRPTVPRDEANSKKPFAKGQFSRAVIAILPAIRIVRYRPMKAKVSEIRDGSIAIFPCAFV